MRGVSRAAAFWMHECELRTSAAALCTKKCFACNTRRRAHGRRMAALSDVEHLCAIYRQSVPECHQSDIHLGGSGLSRA